MTVPLGNDQVKVGVEEVGDANAHIHVPTQEVQLLGEALNTFLAWPTHLGTEEPVKPIDRSDPDVDPIYLMTLTIPQLFLKPLQVSWDAIGFKDSQGSKSKVATRWIIVKLTLNI
ncbi:hypothetical protein GmHk_03G006879 [Glycine max]|nr:hypothetical protein GmHk_03G006879 [Glycine max]